MTRTTPQYTWDSHEWLGVVYGPRGAVAALFPAESESIAATRAEREWHRLRAKFMKRDTGAEPVWEVYRRQR